METLYLVKPSLAKKEEILAYKQAFTGEHLHGGSHLQQMDNFEEWLEHVENEASPATCRPQPRSFFNFYLHSRAGQKNGGHLQYPPSSQSGIFGPYRRSHRLLHSSE